MTDRFKFRAWNTIARAYVVGYIKENGYFELDELLFEDEFGDDWDYVTEYENNIIEQCTGLKDKNGKLIYENDYIENDNTKDDVYLVVFDEKTARFMAKEMNGNLRLINKNVRVVGNIHENPELLKESK